MNTIVMGAVTAQKLDGRQWVIEGPWGCEYFTGSTAQARAFMRKKIREESARK